jgi:hypothetical protein
LRAAGALRAAAELRAAEKPRSAAGRLRPDEPVLAPEPVIAPEPVGAPEPPRAEQPVIAPEQVVPPAPMPVPRPEPPRAPEQVRAPEPAPAHQPVMAAEPPRRVEPPRATWQPPQAAPGTIGWLWPEDNGTGTGGPRYRPRGRTASGGWRYRTATLVALGAVVLAAGGIVIGMSLRGHAGTPTAGAKTSAPARAKTSPALTTPLSSAPGIQPGPLAGGRVGNDEQLAAAWAAHQLSPGTIVACDPQMCSALAAGGFPTGQQARLAQNSQSLSGASLVAVTPRLRQLFAAHPSFGTDVAPVVLASFGTGRALVTIQPVDPAGGAAYQASFSKDVQDRIRVGQELLNSGKLSAAPKAHAALVAGDVDPRILLAIKALIQQLSGVKIASFGDSGPGVSPGVPFRAANFVATDLSAGETPQAYLQQMIAVLRAHASFPAIQHATPVTMANGLTAVGIMYFAPSPLGLVSGG